ncbi:site-specific DNA-methyltransferase [Corynebacterium sp. HS2168-gen11]|uniref:site-specific DNA-methyltransferase n=1 Tax=Corynebacterium sp. HS2168-gen11 TaxID=2974027 RepID=UPI00216AD577|nr:site-specific DNA-methyltransferase [Corynebacterium sp. HS2168-gen11]MCS4536500.1 site-specific DNA-methyltransferase [Corynebacterium sp. HS2168-gen11]
MIESEDPSTRSDFKTEAAVKLAEILPEIITDGKIDFDTLKMIISPDIEESRERFGLTWPGKTQAMRSVMALPTATLAPDKENSLNWDTTQNVFIEGDNLEVLKILQKHYYGKIKIIYIDPPYNTGNDFIYADDYSDSIGNYFEITGQTSEGRKISTNSESTGRFHSNWLNMMYPRLKIARNLLAEDGVICISIDDSEQARLREMCDEIFGENSYVSTFIIDKTAQGANQSLTFKQQHEYMLMYVRQSASALNSDIQTEIDDKKYKFSDSRGLYAITNSFDSINSPLSANRNRGYTIYYNEQSGDAIVRDEYDRDTDTFGDVDQELVRAGFEPIRPGIRNGIQYPWNWTSSRFLEEYKSELVIKRNREGKLAIYHKNRATGLVKDTTLKKFDTRKSGSQLVADLLGGKYFDYPKSIEMLQWVLTKHNDKEGLILDFFAGSGTTAHAVMKLNATDGGNRRCISVQLPEPTPKESAAREAGFKTIADISRERIRRASMQILEDEASKLDGRTIPLDVGFRAYKLSGTNFAKWKADSNFSGEELVGLFENLTASTNDDARLEALLTEILLELAFSLSEKIETIKISGLSVFSVADGLVLAYLDSHTTPTLDQLREIVAREPERLVILEDIFAGDDELKTNLVQECRRYNVDLWTK